MTGESEGGYVLPVRLEPYRDESLAGFIMRYAAELRFPVPEQMLQRLGGRRDLMTVAALDPAGAGKSLSGFLHLSAEQLGRMTLWHPDATAQALRGHQVAYDMSEFATRLICPACLRDACYHRDIWLVRAMPACAIHNARLLHNCPACGQQLKWRGAHVHRCGRPDCGADLRDFEGHPVSASDMHGISGLLGILEGQQHPSGLGFADALKAVYTLGRLKSGVRGRRRAATVVTNRSTDMPALLASGWQAFDPWPGAYHAYLGDLMAAAGPGRGHGLKGAFGVLFEQIRRRKDDAWVVAMRGELATFAAGRPDIVLRRDVVRRGSWGGSGTPERISLNEAATILGVSVSTMKTFATRQGLVPLGPANAGRLMLSAEQVRNLAGSAAGRSEIATHDTAAKLLGMSLITVSALVKDGLLPSIPASDRAHRRLSIRMADLQALLAAFEASAAGLPVVAEPGSEHRVIMNGARSVIRAVLDGSRLPVAVWSEGVGLRRYLMPRAKRRRAAAPQ
jgi:hypothetical protein